MDMSTKLTECQKAFLFNSRYEPTEWSFGQKIPKYICKKRKVDIYCDISDNLNSNLSIDSIFDIHERMLEEMFNVCKECKYYN